MSNKLSFTTPKGNFLWAFVSQPRKNLQNKDEFSINVEVEPEDAEEAIAKIQQFWDENKPKGAKKPKSLGYKLVEETGKVVFTLKTGATYPDGTPKVIKIFNAKAQEIELPQGQKIGNGSRGRASGQLAIYDSGVAAQGVTIYLDAIQMTKFTPYTGGSKGFEVDDEDEGGFEGFSQKSFTPDDEV